MSPKCELCGEPMPAGEEMFKFHGYSGPCPKSPLPEPAKEDTRAATTLTDSMIIQMLGEADAAERRAGADALAIGCTPQQVHDIALGARCETIRSYLYQAGILGAEER